MCILYHLTSLNIILTLLRFQLFPPQWTLTYLNQKYHIAARYLLQDYLHIQCMLTHQRNAELSLLCD